MMRQRNNTRSMDATPVGPRPTPVGLRPIAQPVADGLLPIEPNGTSFAIDATAGLAADVARGDVGAGPNRGALAPTITRSHTMAATKTSRKPASTTTKAAKAPKGSRKPKATDPAPVAVPQAAQKKAEPMTMEQALSAAKTAFGAHIIGVTDTGVKGQATRVKIKCTDPQQVQGVSVCEGTREIAIQDAFQVVRCRACQARVERKKRQQKRSLKLKQRRAAAKAIAA